MPDLTPMFQNVYNLGTLQKVAVGSAHAECANVVGANAVLLVSSTNCYVAIGDTPVAANTTFYLPANTFIAVACVGSNKVSVIRDSVDGSLFVTPLN